MQSFCTNKIKRTRTHQIGFMFSHLCSSHEECFFMFFIGQHWDYEFSTRLTSHFWLSCKLNIKHKHIQWLDRIDQPFGMRWVAIICSIVLRSRILTNAIAIISTKYYHHWSVEIKSTLDEHLKCTISSKLVVMNRIFFVLFFRCRFL